MCVEKVYLVCEISPSGMYHSHGIIKYSSYNEHPIVIPKQGHRIKNLYSKLNPLYDGKGWKGYVTKTGTPTKKLVHCIKLRGKIWSFHIKSLDLLDFGYEIINNGD